MAPLPLREFLADPMGVSPVFVREFRSRMRHPWAYGVLVGYAALFAYIAPHADIIMPIRLPG